jgi:hypothetical protein
MRDGMGSGLTRARQIVSSRQNRREADSIKNRPAGKAPPHLPLLVTTARREFAKPDGARVVRVVSGGDCDDCAGCSVLVGGGGEENRRNSQVKMRMLCLELNGGGDGEEFRSAATRLGPHRGVERRGAFGE